MTSEELNRAIEFLTQQAANFWVGMDEIKLQQKEFSRGMQELKEQTARFESWAAEVVAIHSRRLDQNDQLIRDHDKEFEEQKRVNQQILARIDFIIDRLFPPRT